jgi:hypothetical protein
VELEANLVGLQLIQLVEPAVVLATLLGVAFGVKLLVWGRGPLRQLRGGSAAPALEHRVAELADRCQQLAEAVVDQQRRLEDYDERLDFAERMLTQRRAAELGAAFPSEFTPY